MTNGKTFFIGLGHQKCGTTWLHKYLCENLNFDGGFAKEYHVWDALDVPLLKSERVGLIGGFLGHRKMRLQFKMQRQTEFYFDYFASRYTGCVDLSGDITPSYSGLYAARLRFIRKQFAKRNVSTKAIILIRDPVSRIKSAVKSNLNKRKYNEGIKFGETDFSRALGQYFKSEHCRLRTSYQHTIARAVSAFGNENVYVGIYENMFSQPEMERISHFCKVPTNLEYAKIVVNKTKNPIEDYTSLDTEIRAHFDEVYRFCNEHFQSTRYLWT